MVTSRLLILTCSTLALMVGCSKQADTAGAPPAATAQTGGGGSKGEGTGQSGQQFAGGSGGAARGEGRQGGGEGRQGGGEGRQGAGGARQGGGGGGAGRQGGQVAAGGGGAQGGGGAGARGGRGGGRGGRGGGAAQAVEVTAVERRDLVESITIVGSFAANESATIRPEASGLVKEIFFKEGQRVRKDEVLLKIDDSELRAQLEQAENADRVAQTNLGRYLELLRSGTATQAEYDKFNSDATAARSSLNVLRVRLGRTEVKAPFDGVVNARTLSPGDNVSTQTIITTIDDLSRLKIDFQVGERYLAKVKQGAPFKVHSGVTGNRIEAAGEVYFVNASIDRATRSVQVKGLIASPPPEFRPGMFATVELVLEVRKGALAVPEGAILALPEGTQVIAVRARGGEHIVEMVPVVRGLRERGLAEITPVGDNLTEGDSIVASGVGSIQLYNGGRVLPRPIKSEFSIEKKN